MNDKITPFGGDQLRLARLASAMSLEELAARVAATRQYIHQLETGAKLPSREMEDALADALGVSNRFFRLVDSANVRPEQCHFRRQSTTPLSITSQVLARGTLLDRLASQLDEELSLPTVDFPDFPVSSMEDVERAAESSRQHWRLGVDGPITNMMRVTERAGAIVTYFRGLSDRVDALSMDRPRPIVVRSDAKSSLCRQRFDLAHECGHLIMHRGIETGDKITEDQAHRYASAFLIPRAAFVREYPRGRTHNWPELFKMKLRWRVAVRAIIRRAYDLQLIDSAQYRVGNIQLSKMGQLKSERYDDELPLEKPELLTSAIDLLSESGGARILKLAQKLALKNSMFELLTDRQLPLFDISAGGNVVSFRR